MSQNHQSTMLKAFLSQTKINDIDADKRAEEIAAIHNSIMQKAMTQLSRSQNISEYMNVPTKINNGELDSKTEVHENFKGYDHSLEKTRIKFKSIKGLGTGNAEEAMNDMFDGSNDVK